MASQPKMRVMTSPKKTMVSGVPSHPFCARFYEHPHRGDALMDAVEMFLLSHAITHELGVGEPEGDFSLGHSRLRGLNEAQVRRRPQGWNSLAFIYWHMARVEDVTINVLVARQPQVLDARGWLARLRVERRDVGTGWSDDEVAALSEAIDLEALRGYRDAVGHRTRDVARAVPEGAWGEIVGSGPVLEAARQGAFAPGAEWVGEFWSGRTTGWLFYWGAVGHNFMHLGQAGWVKEMVRGQRGM